MSEYAHAYDEEPLDETGLYGMYDDMLDETHEAATVGFITFNPSAVLKALDPIAYEVGYSDYISFLVENEDIIELGD